MPLPYLKIKDLLEWREKKRRAKLPKAVQPSVDAPGERAIKGQKYTKRPA